MKEYERMKGTISTLNGKPKKLVDKFIYLDCNISSTKSDVNIWKSNLSDKLKWVSSKISFAVLLNQGTMWLLMKHTVENLKGNYQRMLCAFMNKSLKQHLRKQQMYGLLPPISQTIQVR